MLKEERELICICCPRGCHLRVDKELHVTGNFCPRGEKYARQEVLSPERVVTSTVLVRGGEEELCSVKSERPIPKGKIFEAMKDIDALIVAAPIKMGQILLTNLANTGVDLVATMEIKVRKE